MEEAVVTLRISGTLVFMTRLFLDRDCTVVLAAIPEGTQRVVFIDTPPTPKLVAVIEALLERGIDVLVRDHHDESSPTNHQARQIAGAAGRIRELIGSNAVISNRKCHPACSSLIEVGESAGEGMVIVADPDLDGLTAAMKACGVTYPELDADAAILDGGRAGQTADALSPNGLLLMHAFSAVQALVTQHPNGLEGAIAAVFSSFVTIIETSNEAELLAASVVEILPGVVYVDVAGARPFDMGKLAAKMEGRSGCKVTVQRKAQGPIAAEHGGIQFSLAVARSYQEEFSLQELLPSGFTSSLEAGIISNTTFLLHVSERVWQETVLPALTARFG